MPWPSSILPLKMVTLPFASMRSHASSMRLLSRLPGRRAGEDCGSASSAARLKPMTSAPLDLRNCLREPATELGPVESDVVAQNVEQRSVGVDRQGLALAVHPHAEFSHGASA